MQQALFKMGFDDDEEDEKEKNYIELANGMADSIIKRFRYRWSNCFCS
jgi:hypothetical protein